MPINFNLLAPQQGVAESFFAGQQAAQAEQERNMMRQLQMQQMAAQQENVLAQREQRMAMAEERRYKMADAARREKFLTDLSSKMAEGGHKLDRPTLTSMLQFGMMNKEDALVKLAGEGLRALDEQEQYQREAPKYGLPVAPTAGAAVPPTLAAPAPAAAPSAAFAAPAARPELLAGTPFAIGAGPAPVAAPAAPTAAPAAAPVNALSAGGFTREQVQNMLVSPVASIRARGEALARTLTKEPKQATDIEVMQALGIPLTKEGFAAYNAAKKQERMLTPEEEAQRIRIALASRPPAQPRELSAPVAVVDEKTGKVVLVPREEAMGKTPASAMEGLSPKEIQKREAALPQATSAIKAVETKADSLVRDLKALRNDPGLDQITGPVYGRTPSVSRAGSRAQALYDKIVAKGGFEMLQQMRDASKTGGALGNVSNQEGRQLQAAFAALDRRQNKADVQAAIDQVIGDIEGAKTRTREAYEATYSYKQGGAAPAPAAAPNIDALLNKYK